MDFLAKRNLYVLGVLALILCPVGSVQAGFQFTAPIHQAPQDVQPLPPIQNGLLPVPDAPQVSAAPVAPVVSAAPMPVQVPHDSSTPAPEPSTMDKARTSVSSGLMSLGQAIAPDSQPKKIDMYPVAVGFGKDLPLAIALQQVVPSSYNVVTNRDVPMGAKVSWEGGRPWNIVLFDMIAPLDVRVDISSNRVALAMMPSSAVSVVAPVVAPAPTPTPVAPVVQPPQPSAPPMAITPQTLPVSQPVSVPAPTPIFAPRSTPLPAPAYSAPRSPRSTWSAARGDSLRSVLEGWSNLAEAELFWSSDFDFPLAGDVNLSGTFEQAVENLLRGFSEAKPKPIARLHPNLPHGPAMLVVETRQVLD